jgi:aryl-alcohol dehydrogenase-like predicted oxidoreductase
MRLGLGTVQFGADYGISNTFGRSSVQEVASVLAYADRVGIDVLDTAAAYGDSEAVLGELLWPGHRFRVVTKISALDPLLDSFQRARSVRESLRASLDRLHLASVYGVLLHRATDAAGPDGVRLAAALQELKQEGFTRKVGISVYGANELEAALANFMPDIVQLPSNVLDQRLLHSGWLARLEAMGVEIHLRSAFLQGLLLMPAGRRPAGFERYKEELERFDRFCANRGLTPLEATLGYMRQLPGDVTIVGVTRREEFEEIVCAMGIDKAPTLDEYSELASDDEGLVNPSNWRLHLH